MNAVDTNVLFYAHDSRETAKQAAAVSLIESLHDGALLWQVACEYLSASKKLEPFGYDRDQAWRDVRDLRLVWATILPSWESLDRAYGLLSKYSLSYWDAMLLGACLEGGVTRLFTEDFDAYPDVEGLEIINPFTDSR